MFQWCCESVCNFTGARLARACGPVICASDYAPHRVAGSAPPVGKHDCCPEREAASNETSQS